MRIRKYTIVYITCCLDFMYKAPRTKLDHVQGPFHCTFGSSIESCPLSPTSNLHKRTLQSYVHCEAYDLKAAHTCKLSVTEVPHARIFIFLVLIHFPVQRPQIGPRTGIASTDTQDAQHLPEVKPCLSGITFKTI